MPAAWLQALIYPIPKSLQNDQRVPLNYRGISLLPVISKLYTATLNKRLNIFTENNATIVNEQNGFLHGRSCLGHIFVLQNTLRIRYPLNSETYCAFIDFKRRSTLSVEISCYKITQIWCLREVLPRHNGPLFWCTELYPGRPYSNRVVWCELMCATRGLAVPNIVLYISEWFSPRNQQSKCWGNDWLFMPSILM